MRNPFIASLIALSIVAGPALVGCNKTESETKTTRTNPETGQTAKDEKKVEKTPDGGTKTTEEHKVTNP
jgi:hypothetical protein